MVRMLPPGQLVRVNLAGVQVGSVVFHAAVTDAVGRFVRQVSEDPPKSFVRLHFSFPGVDEVEVPESRQLQASEVASPARRLRGLRPRMRTALAQVRFKFSTNRGLWFVHRVWISSWSITPERRGTSSTRLSYPMAPASRRS